jgi:hypothetical protein
MQITQPVVPHEINAYIATRDSLLAQAEKMPSFKTIDSAAVANEVVRSCVNPTRPVYSAQRLPEEKASRERERCKSITKRLVKLRSAIN